MVKKTYTPDRGDIVWLTLDPVKGHEQKGRRPALVISPKKYNAMTNMMLACPITSIAKEYPFEVEVRSLKINGVVISDQVRALAWKDRRANFIVKVSTDVLEDVIKKIKLLIS